MTDCHNVSRRRHLCSWRKRFYPDIIPVQINAGGSVTDDFADGKLVKAITGF